MIQSLSLPVRRLIVAGLLMGSFLALYALPKWGTAANWVYAFLYRDAFLTLIGTSLVISLLRKFLLQRPPRFIVVYLLYLTAYLLIFHSRFMPANAQPTYLTILLFFHGMALFLSLLLDPITEAFAKWRGRTYPGWVRSPFTILLLVWGVIWGFESLLLPGTVSRARSFLNHSFYPCLLLSPLLSAWVRNRYLGRMAAYPPGLVIYTVFVYLGIVLFPRGSLTFLRMLAPFYLAFWVHLYLEEIGFTLKQALQPAQNTRFGTWVSTWMQSFNTPAQVVEAPAPLISPAASENVKEWLRALPAKLKEKGAGLGESAKTYQKYIRWTLYGIAFLSIGLTVGPKIYQRFFVTVVEFTPSGEVAEKTVIRITFSEAVQPRDGNLAQVNCFKIEPPLSGSYRQETPKTIVFVPSEPLSPSTRYVVRFDPQNLAASKKRIQKRASTEFNTVYFAVQDAKLFYAYDLVTNEERQLMGEINFNFPIALEELRKNIRVLKGKDQPISVELEKSHVPTKFYFKTSSVQREKEEQVITLELAKGTRCVGCSVGLEQDYSQTLVLPSKVKLEVAELKLWHETGNTLVTILFNMPVSEAQVRSRLSIQPGIPIEIETEYCYAVLRGPFKPNVSYRVKIAKGLVSKSGEALEKDYVGSVYIQDLPPKVEFAYPGNILSLSGPKTLQVKTVNLDKVHVEIQKVFRNNLIQFLSNPGYSPMTKHIYSGDYTVEGGQINEELTQHINLSKFHNEPYKGLFTISLGGSGGYYDRDNAWFLCTDLGMIAKHSGDDLIVTVLSIATLAPQAGATVELYSETNQVMDKQVADGAGRVTFVNWKKNEYKFLPQFVIAKKEDDFSFLVFDRNALNQYQYGVGGDPYGREGMDAFLSTERGVYRPGESAYITAVVRNADNSLPPPIPVRLVVRDPRGAEVQRIEETLGANGLRTYKIPFSGDALTGTYEIQIVRVDKEASLGATTLKVEEFIPDKLKVDVEPPKDAVKPNEQLTFKVKSRQMFGPPASGNKVSAQVRFISQDFSHPDYKGYTFSNNLKSFEEEIVDLGESTLEKNGIKDYTVEIPRNNPPSALKAYIYAEVFDSGGRPVSAAGFADINPYSYYLGIKRSGTGTIHVRQKVDLNVVSIDPAGRPQSVDNVRLVIKRKAWYSIFRRGSWGRSGYQSSSYEELIDNKEIAIRKQGTFSFTPEQPGEYTVILAGPNGMRSSHSFEVLGAGYETTSLEAPEKLKIRLDKETYDIGDEAKVFIQAPFTGKLILTVEREKVYQTRTIDLSSRETVVSLPVEKDFLPNAYVVGVVLRTPDESRKTLPMVSFGIAPLPVKTHSKRIGITWDLPTAVQSADGLDVSLQVSGSDRPDVILAAVDQGILQITNFQTPDPLGYFYRKRGLTTQTYSIFDLVLPDVAAKKFALGGDGGGFSRRHLNPIAAKKKKSLALFSGVVKPDENGRVRYHFDTKGFNGEVRVMAMALQGDRFGSSDRAVQVADPIVLIPNLPRFAGPLDEFQIPVELYNKTGKPGTFSVRITAKGPVKLMKDAVQNFSLGKEDQKKILFFAAAGSNAGVAQFQIVAEGNGARSVHDEEISIRPYTTLQTMVQEGELNPGQSKDVRVPGGFIPFGQKVRLTVSNNPIVRYLRSLDYLITYPYGCAEQTASRIFPLLYFKNLGFATGRFGEQANAVDLYIQEGIHKLEKMQLSTGEFTMWPGGQSADAWLTKYIAHCLIEAKAMGYSVNPTVLQRMHALIRQGSVVAQNTGRLDRSTHNTNRSMDAYLLYLKALIGEPDHESMSVMRTQRLKELSESDRALLSMAYSRLGDRPTAAQVLAPDFKSKFLYREQYGSFNSPVRNTAMYLSALVQAEPDSRRVFEIVEYLGQQIKNGHFGSTQENVWVFMALAKVYAALDTSAQTELLLGGAPYKTLDGKENVLSDNSLSGKTLTIKNAGPQKSFYYVMGEGTPLQKNTRSRSNGLTISRMYYDKTGEPVNLSNVVQGEMLIATLSIKAEKGTVQNVVIVDLLPAGLEIENPRLSSRGQLDFEPQVGLSAAYQDIRDDRILLFSDSIAGEQHFSYAVRAVTPGRFNIPNAYAEAMYDPDVNAESVEEKPLVIIDNNAQ
jgi:alpha-2-macroglobulin